MSWRRTWLGACLVAALGGCGDVQNVSLGSEALAPGRGHVDASTPAATDGGPDANGDDSHLMSPPGNDDGFHPQDDHSGKGGGGGQG